MNILDKIELIKNSQSVKSSNLLINVNNLLKNESVPLSYLKGKQSMLLNDKTVNKPSTNNRYNKPSNQ